MEIEMIVWSDNDNIREVSDIIHNEGYRTAEIRKESLGAYEDKCNWSFCKLNMIDSFCVDTNSAMGRTVDINDVDEQPMFRYVVYIIVGADDNTADDNTADDNTDDDNTENVVMNIGMTTKNGVKIDIDSAIDRIGAETDCTITRCVGFYHGHKEYSLRVDVYDIEIDRAVSMASYFCHIFNQQCVAVTVGNYTVFVTDDYTDVEFVAWCDELEK